MAYRTTQDQFNFQKIFPAQGGPPQLDNVVTDFIQRGVEAIGWSKLDRCIPMNIDTAGPIGSTFDQNPVPAGFCRIYLYAAGFHSDGAASHTLQLGFNLDKGSGVLFYAASDGKLVAANIAMVPEHKLLVGLPGMQLGVFATPSIPVAANLRFRSLFVDLPLGEYLPHL